VIISAADRKAVTLAEMAENFVDYDVVFFGEFHDVDVLHVRWNMKCCSNCMPFMVTKLVLFTGNVLRQITSSF